MLSNICKQICKWDGEETYIQSLTYTCAGFRGGGGVREKEDRSGIGETVTEEIEKLKERQKDREEKEIEIEREGKGEELDKSTQRKRGRDL